MNQTTYNQKQAVSGVAQRRASGQAGQSVAVAIIVLFLLLFLAGIFIAIIAGNIKNTQRATNTSAGGRFSEAGIKYLDEQLTNSPEGADWRPQPFGVLDSSDVQDVDGDGIPEPVDVDVNGNGILNVQPSLRDPDYFWLQLYRSATNVGGYTRVDFGSDVGGGTDRGPSVGGRSLVRVTYRPTPPIAPNQPVAAPIDPLSRYIKLESVGRVGQIIAIDPTTYTRTEGLGLRVELEAYKSISLNEYVRQIYNKDNKANSVALGNGVPVMDRPPIAAASAARVRRDTETVIKGPIRVNAGLTFHGIHRIILDPRYNQSVEVAGDISLNGISNTETAFTANDPTQVYIYVQQGGAAQLINRQPPAQAALPVSVIPSGSPIFGTLGPETAAVNGGIGFPLVRDNHGNNIEQLPVDADANGNTFQNQRTVGRQQPPTMDAVTGPNNMTRYLALTRDAPPMAPPFTTTNPVSAALGGRAGLFGWGGGFYIPNTADVQNSSENLFGGSSLRGDWMNPPQNAVGNPADKARWHGDFEYVPEGVIITLYPAYFTVEVSAHDGANGTRRQYFFRKPDAPNEGGRLTSIRKILRYTRTVGLVGEPIGFGTNVVQPEAKFEGYPADTFGIDRVPGTNDDTAYYAGEFVIYAEGNIRIRGVVGGLDPETGAYFKRNLTVVSNANIYIDGNLLRDNITASDTNATAQAVKGQSTIALLAKNYIAINTTQFHTPQQELFESEALAEEVPFARVVRNKPGQQSRFSFRTTLGPTRLDTAVGQGFIDPLTDYPITPAIFLRHASASRAGGTTNINLFVNEFFDNNLNQPMPNKLDFGGFGYVGVDTQTMGLNGSSNAGSQDPVFIYNRFDINPIALLYPANGFPYNDGNFNPGNPQNPPTLGTDNVMAVNVDSSYSLPQTTSDYLMTRVGVAPLDIRIEALMYAQEGSFFIIPGPWFNPNPNDTYENFLSGDPDRGGRRAGEEAIGTGRVRVNPLYPFYKEPMDIRLTFCGSINENLPAEIADQGAWMEKWGWIPRYYGATGLTEAAGYPDMGNVVPTVHGPNGNLAKVGVFADPVFNGVAGGNGIIFEYDERALAPYAPQYSGSFSAIGTPLRRNPYNLADPLPFAPRLPVAPGLLYYGQKTITDSNIVQPPIP